MKPILIMELRGFAKLATELAKELDEIGVEASRVRAAGIEVVRTAIKSCTKDSDFTQEMHLGGDTWYWNFETIKEAVEFAIKLLRELFQIATYQGLYYLKPSLALGLGKPKFDGERFLDDASIGTYRVADGGSSFTLAIVGEAANEISKVGNFKLKAHPKHADRLYVRLLDWRGAGDPPESRERFALRVPELLLDTDLIYSNSPSEAIANLIRYQEQSDSAYVFGGPAPLSDPLFGNYIKNTIALLSSDATMKMTVLSYLPLDEPEMSYAWIELCRQLLLSFPSKFAFAAFSIAKGQLRPFSYHIYNRNTVHVGLRSYSTQRGTPTLSSSIMFKNRKIAERFETDFLENFRSVGALNDKAYAQLISKLRGPSAEVKGRIQAQIRDLLP